MSKPFILMIEDNPSDIELLRMALDQTGEAYQLVSLPDGAAALKFVRQQQDCVDEPEPCIMLLDFHLPKYDGIEVLTAVRSEPKLQNVQVVMMASSPIRREEEAKVETLGAIFRQKPRHLSEVQELAEDVLDLCKRSLQLT